MLVDTAGMRRKRHQRQGIEYYSELRALEAAERADVAIVLVDASEGVVEQDLSVADVARKAGCATVVVLSKWDVTEVRIEDVRPQLEPGCASARRSSRCRRRRGAASSGCSTPSRACSHVRGPHPDGRAEPRARGAPRGAPAARPKRGRRLNLLYGTQVSSRPPRFRLFVNDRGLVTRDYGYWVENELRRRFRLEGVPVSIDFVTSE